MEAPNTNIIKKVARLYKFIYVLYMSVITYTSTADNTMPRIDVAIIFNLIFLYSWLLMLASNP